MLHLTPFANACVSIQSFVLRRCASASSSGLLVNSGLKCYQFNCGIWAGWIGYVGIGCAGGTDSCTEGETEGGWGAGRAGSAGGAGGPPSPMFTYIVCSLSIYFYPNLSNSCYIYITSI